MTNSATPTNRTATGFRGGLHQPCEEMTLHLRDPGDLDLARLDASLKRHFAVAVPSQAARYHLPADIPVAQLARRIFLLANNLLQAIGVPSFDEPLIRRIRPLSGATGQFELNLLMPVVDCMPVELTDRALRLAMRLVLRLQQPVDAGPDLEEIFKAVQSGFVEPGQRVVRSGKSTIPILVSAYAKHIPVSHLGLGIYQLGWGSASRIFDRSACDLDTAVGLKISHDKDLSGHILQQAGLPVPPKFIAANATQALAAAHRIGYPVVIKPADRDRGEGITTDIASDASVREAFAVARRLSQRVLVEKQVPGICHRIFVAGGRVLYVVKRLPKSVIGDGKLTVAELVQRANAEQELMAVHLRQPAFPADQLAEDTMRAAGFTLETVPPQGSFVPLRRIESTEWGGTPEVMTDVLHEENRRIALKAASLTRLNVAGIDLISTDIRRPWFENGAAINEVNFAPRLGMRFEYQIGAIDAMLGDAFPGCGRLPVEVFVGGKALDAAMTRQKALVRDGRRCFLSTHATVLDPSGKPAAVALGKASLFTRTRALLLDPGVDALVLVVQTDELLHTGLPVDSIDGLHVIDDQLAAWGTSRTSLPAGATKMLLRQLQAYCLGDGIHPV